MEQVFTPISFQRAIYRHIRERMHFLPWRMLAMTGLLFLLTIAFAGRARAQLPAVTDSATSQTACGDTSLTNYDKVQPEDSDNDVVSNVQHKIASWALPNGTDTFSFLFDGNKVPYIVSFLFENFSPFKGWSIIDSAANGFGFTNIASPDGSWWLLSRLLPCVIITLLTMAFNNYDNKKIPPRPGTKESYLHHRSRCDITWGGYLLACSCFFGLALGGLAAAIMLVISFKRYFETK